MADDTNDVEVTEEMCERLAKTGRAGGHDYGIGRGTRDCKYGCGCSMGPWKSNGPPGVDPWGSCPNNPKPDDTIYCPICDTPLDVVGVSPYPAIPEGAVRATCPLCGYDSFAQSGWGYTAREAIAENVWRELNYGF